MNLPNPVVRSHYRNGLITQSFMPLTFRIVIAANSSWRRYSIYSHSCSSSTAIVAIKAACFAALWQK